MGTYIVIPRHGQVALTELISIDVGGTSTDVSRYAGRYEVVYETTTAGVTIQSPQLDINTVAAGGGSCLSFRNGLFLAGPNSAGAEPGPTCYRCAEYAYASMERILTTTIGKAGRWQ